MVPSWEFFGPPGGDLGCRGSFELIARLGATATDVSYLGVSREKEASPQVVIVTEPLPELKGDPCVLQKFLDRARLGARLDHPSIARTFHVETLGDCPFVATEFVDGQPLSALVPRAQQRALRLPLPALLRIVLDVLGALEYAHSLRGADGQPLGVVHGRVGPTSVVVTYEGQVKLVDFAMIGGDPDVDRFAVGLMLWEGLVGHAPLAEANGATSLGATSSVGSVQRVADAWPDVDRGLASVADRAVQVESRGGYASTTELRRDLENCVRSRDIALPDARSLGGLVARVFKDDSGGLRHLVASCLASAGASDEESPPSPLSVRQPLAARIVDLESSDIITAVPDAQETGGVDSSAMSSQAPSSLSIPPRVVAVRSSTGSPKALVVAIATALGAILATVTIRLDRPDRPSGEIKAAATLPSPPATIAAPMVAPSENIDVPEMSHVVVIASPRSATIYVDDAPVANPYVADEPRSTSAHSLRIEAPGYETKTRTISLAEDLDLEVVLERPVAKARRMAPPPPAASTCQPPYVVDEVTGKKRWRIECL